MTRPVPTPPSALRESFKTQGPNASRLVVLHDTEGGSPSSVVNTLRSKGLGIHWIVGEKGACIRGVDSDLATAHVAAYNDESIGIEQCGFASYRRSRWMRNGDQLLLVAWIVAYETQRHGIPLVLVDPGNPNAYARGVTTHSRLGSEGGGHHDPGDGYPLSHVLGMASSIQARGLGKLERIRVTLAAHGRLS